MTNTQTFTLLVTTFGPAVLAVAWFAHDSRRRANRLTAANIKALDSSVASLLVLFEANAARLDSMSRRLDLLATSLHNHQMDHLDPGRHGATVVRDGRATTSPSNLNGNGARV